jgi:uncharacterized membrane protein
MVESAATTGSRVGAIDATRGAAMLFVFLSHFANAYFTPNGLPADWVFGLTMVASPTFMLVSGSLLGYFSVTRRERFFAVVLSYAGRGLFLLTVGRVVIVLAHVALAGGIRDALRWAFITDVIGACLIVGPPTVARTTRTARLGIAAALIACTWVAVTNWDPPSAIGKLVEEALCGPYGPYGTRWFADVFPLLPWLGLFLIGTCIGEGLASVSGDARRRWPRMAAGWSAGFLGFGAALWAVGWRLAATSQIVRVLRSHRFFSPFHKLPPSPVYFAVYGAIGLAMLALLLWSEPWRVLGPLRSVLEVLGRNSLMAFVAGYVMYFTVVVVADVGFTPLWPAGFLLTVVILVAATYAWDRTGWTRRLTLRVPSPLRRALARAAAVPSPDR